MESAKQSIPCFLISSCGEKMAWVSTAKRVVVEWLLGSSADISELIGPLWKLVKSYLIVPVLRFALYVCLVLSFLLFVEWVHMMFLAALAKIIKKKPAKRYKWEPVKDDLESGSSDFPMVLVQIPIYNEIEVGFLFEFVFTPTPTCACEVRKCAEGVFVVLWGQVYKISIGAACRLSWPADRLVVQVLDDSTDLVIKVFWESAKFVKLITWIKEYR